MLLNPMLHGNFWLTLPTPLFPSQPHSYTARRWITVLRKSFFFYQTTTCLFTKKQPDILPVEIQSQIPPIHRQLQHVISSPICLPPPTLPIPTIPLSIPALLLVSRPDCAQRTMPAASHSPSTIFPINFLTPCWGLVSARAALAVMA